MKYFKNISIIAIVFALSTTFVFSNSESVTIKTVKVGNGPSTIVVNPITNMVYANNINDDTISVINGSDNKVTAINNIVAERLTINPIKNKIYTDPFSIINWSDNTVIPTILDISSIDYLGIVVNPDTNTVYVTNTEDSNVSVFSGTNNNIITNNNRYWAFSCRNYYKSQNKYDLCNE